MRGDSTAPSEREGPGGKDSNTPAAPSLAFLGVCERVALVREGHPAIWPYNIIGLRQTIGCFFYPARLSGWHLLLACYQPKIVGSAQVRLVAEEGDEFFKLEFAVQEHPAEQEFSTAVEERNWRFAPPGPGWLLFDHPLDAAVVPKPGPVAVMCATTGSAERRIGTLYCGLFEPMPLTAERIAAIRSDPRAAKHVRIVLGCTKCSSKLTVHAGIERSRNLDVTTEIWYQDAPDTWACSCGATIIDLQTVRRNLHGALGTRVAPGTKESPMTFVQMYERGALADVCAAFGALLDDDPSEDAVQQFFEEHSVFLHTFNPTKIKPKAPVLTKHETDFAILDSRGVLVLVELERPGIRLLRKDGNITKDLQHAFGQARSWLHTFTHHRAAALDCMGFEGDEVATAKAVVIAGRDHGYPAEHLMRLKGADHGQVDFYTYDDVLEATVALARQLA